MRRSDVYVEIPMMDCIFPWNRRTEPCVVIADGWVVSVSAHNGELKVVVTSGDKEPIIVKDKSSPHYKNEGVIVFRRSDDG